MKIVNISSLILLLTVISHAAPEEPKPFFDTLEYQIRDDYRICTGDSTQQSLDFLILWKQQVDALLESDSFTSIAGSYYLETGLTPSEVRPCDIIIWNQNKGKLLNEAQRLLSDDVADRQKMIRDSLTTDSILRLASLSPLDFKGIPFGIPKKLFIMMIGNALNDSFSDGGSSIQFSRISFEGVFVKTAFHFDKNGYYRMYELESDGGSLDSLDSKVRIESAELSSLIEIQSATPPEHIFRIGRFDITQGRLAVERSWNFENVAAFVGLATYKYHYYAKAVVLARDVTILADSSDQKK